MKQQFYPGINRKNGFATLRKACLVTLVFLGALLPKAKAQQELIFKNPSLQSGQAGQDNAIYQFTNVTAGVNALVKITGRSNALVKLVDIDLATTGFDKAFQPQVTYNNGTTPSGTSDWWMEFTISFVNSNNSPANVSAFNITALDIDGNADKINEWVSFYGQKSYTLENNTQLQYASIWEMINSVNTVVGTRFNGPIANYTNIDTSATRVMATTTYQTVNTLRIRTGGHSTGSSGAADRMYSFWFKAFTYQKPVELGLPVTLKSFSVKLDNKKPMLSWVSSREENLSAYVIERSTDGSEYKDIAMVFANGTTELESRYSYQDNALPAAKGILYYRLRMIDMDQKYRYSETRLVKFTEGAKSLSIQVYPNPAVNEVRVTIPASWQDKKVQYDIFNVSGQTVKRVARTNASQTEVMDISSLLSGTYIVRASAEGETITQQFVKSK